MRGAIGEGERGILEGSHLGHLVAVAGLETGDGGEALWQRKRRRRGKRSRSTRWKCVDPIKGAATDNRRWAEGLVRLGLWEACYNKSGPTRCLSGRQAQHYTFFLLFFFFFFFFLDGKINHILRSRADKYYYYFISCCNARCRRDIAYFSLAAWATEATTKGVELFDGRA